MTWSDSSQTEIIQLILFHNLLATKEVFYSSPIENKTGARDVEVP